MTEKKKNNHTRYGNVIRKTLITLLSGGLTYIITNMSAQPLIWVLTVTVLISGVALVIQFMNDFDHQLQDFGKQLENLAERHPVYTTEIQSLIEEGFAKADKAAGLFRAVENSPLQTKVITQLVQHSTQIGPDCPPLIQEFAQSQINRTSQVLKELSEGGVVPHDGEENEWLLELTKQSQRTIDAISLSTVDAGATGFRQGLWTSDFGQQYLELQRRAIQRGVRIRRVFVLDGSVQIEDSDFQLVHRRQRMLGINARVLERDMIPHTLKNVMYDFVVFDHDVSYEVTPASHIEEDMGPTIVKTHLTLQTQRIQERIQRFEKLWDCARELDEVPSPRRPDPSSAAQRYCQQ
jgi:hypothetical protein